MEDQVDGGKKLGEIPEYCFLTVREGGRERTCQSSKGRMGVRGKILVRVRDICLKFGKKETSTNDL